MSLVRTRTLRFLAFLLPFLALAAKVARADDDSKWLRITRVDGVLESLDASITRCEGRWQAADGVARDVAVSLVAAIHIAEEDFYNALNDEFAKYDVVVFELVADDDVKLESKAERAKMKEEQKAQRKSFNPLNLVSILQEGVGEALGLTYQIDGVDYGAPNFRRGDCTPSEFVLKLLSNGDVVAFAAETQLESLLAENSGVFEGWAVALACAKDKRLAARRLMALELARDETRETEKETRALSSNAQDATERENAVVHFRNKKALEVVREELDAGRTEIALFYGAAHMPDLSTRLENDFNLHPTGDPRWLQAWRLSARDAQ